jgi:hypothetical protein
MFFWTALKTSRHGHPLDVFKEGADARAAGKRLSDNPHCVASDAHREWAEGWRATLDLDEDDDLESCRDRADRGV